MRASPNNRRRETTGLCANGTTKRHKKEESGVAGRTKWYQKSKEQPKPADLPFSCRLNIAEDCVDPTSLIETELLADIEALTVAVALLRTIFD
jgi:hypothetical protein